MVAVERSAEAAAVARGNAERLGLDVKVVEGDLLAPMAAGVVGGTGAFDVVVSNPPYIPTAEIDGLAAEVKKEPRAALDGGKDGLDVIRRLVADAPAVLVAGGALVIEVGAGQAKAVVELIGKDGRYAAAVEVRKDLGGVERVVAARKK